MMTPKHPSESLTVLTDLVLPSETNHLNNRGNPKLFGEKRRDLLLLFKDTKLVTGESFAEMLDAIMFDAIETFTKQQKKLKSDASQVIKQIPKSDKFSQN